MHVWRTPHGYRFRVDGTGTHLLGRVPKPRTPLERAFATVLDS